MFSGFPFSGFPFSGFPFSGFASFAIGQSFSIVCLQRSKAFSLIHPNQVIPGGAYTRRRACPSVIVSL